MAASRRSFSSALPGCVSSPTLYGKGNLTTTLLAAGPSTRTGIQTLILVNDLTRTTRLHAYGMRPGPTRTMGVPTLRWAQRRPLSSPRELKGRVYLQVCYTCDGQMQPFSNVVCKRCGRYRVTHVGCEERELVHYQGGSNRFFSLPGPSTNDFFLLAETKGTSEPGK